ncbi:MAG TPA: Gfo/Idh/MocA family oxidoreductase [Spirochaetia bacterium]|nr:Gfo/Idh/MocA family oxidoreductase [Spirochaetia bacterium]
MSKLRVGIIGQGRSGHDIHVVALTRHAMDLYDVVAVADPVQERLHSDLLGKDCASYTDYRQLFGRKDIDLIVNASPSHLHVPITIEALKAGFNVLCEKPLARKASEVDKLVATARKAGKVLAIFQQSRFAPHFQQIRSVIQSGVLGRIVMVKIRYNGFSRRWDWQTLQEYNGGSLLNTGPHPMDQALQLFGTDLMPTVACAMDRANTFGDAEDVVKVMLSGKGRPIIDVEICSCSAYNGATYQVNGTNGSISGSQDHLDWKYFKPEEAPPQKLIREPLPGRAWCTETLRWHTGSWDIPKDGIELFDRMAKAFYTDLHEALTQGRPLTVRPEHVRRQIEVIEECHRQNPLSRLKA